MGQTGVVGGKDIRAWAVGARTGYTFAQFAWQPRLGLQMDAASGDHHPADNVLGTFNPLFPNGYYFTLAGFTGYVNLFHVKTIFDGKARGQPVGHGRARLPMARDHGGCDLRASPTFRLPERPARVAPGRAPTGNCASTIVFNANLTGALEAVHYKIGNTIRQAGGHDGDYVGVELKYAL